MFEDDDGGGDNDKYNYYIYLGLFTDGIL